MFLHDDRVREVATMYDTVAHVCYIVASIARVNNVLVGEQRLKEVFKRSAVIVDRSG